MNPEDWDIVAPPVGSFDRIVVLDEVASTQDEARRLARGTPGMAVIGLRQIAGRGRQGRAWEDSHGLALSVSMVVRSDLPPAGLSLAVGLGVLDACEAFGVDGLGLKWPNDVVERATQGKGRKLAGVLIESTQGIAVAGVGLNVGQNDDDWSGDLAETAVSLRQLGIVVDRPVVARAVLERVSHWLCAGAGSIRRRWRDVGTLRRQNCLFRVEGRAIQGMVVGLDEQWRLVLECHGGRRVRIDAAHAHLEQAGQAGSLTEPHG